MRHGSFVLLMRFSKNFNPSSSSSSSIWECSSKKFFFVLSLNFLFIISKKWTNKRKKGFFCEIWNGTSAIGLCKSSNNMREIRKNIFSTKKAIEQAAIDVLCCGCCACVLESNPNLAIICRNTERPVEPAELSVARCFGKRIIDYEKYTRETTMSKSIWIGRLFGRMREWQKWMEEEGNTERLKWIEYTTTPHSTYRTAGRRRQWVERKKYSLSKSIESRVPSVTGFLHLTHRNRVTSSSSSTSLSLVCLLSVFCILCDVHIASNARTVVNIPRIFFYFKTFLLQWQSFSLLLLMLHSSINEKTFGTSLKFTNNKLNLIPRLLRNFILKKYHFVVV